jgi:hypothetical protein
MARRQRVDSATGAVDVMATAGMSILPPKCEPLDLADMPYWEAIVRARAKAEWSEENRIIAAKLARAMADEKRIVLELRAEGDLIENARGTSVINPKHGLVEQLARRVMAWRKALAIDARGADGRVSDIAKRRDASLAHETNVPFDDDLLAKPRLN